MHLTYRDGSISESGQAGSLSDDLDIASLTVVRALPLARFYPEGAPEIFERLAGACILEIGGAAEGGIEGGGLIIDYVPAGSDAPRRVVFAFNENGMWVESEGLLIPTRA